MVKKEKITYTFEEPEESEGQVKKLRAKLKECQKEKEENLTQVQRARADLINSQRRQEQVLEELGKYGQENFIRELLPVLDSLIIGAKGNQDIRQIKEQLEATLLKYGLKEIKAIGQKFNPQFHEAIEQVKAKKEAGTVAEEVQKGYMLGDKILRPSKVKVAK